MSILNTLYQGETWGKNEEAVPILHMDTRHIKNVVSWIWRNRASLKLQAEAEMAFSGYHPADDGASDLFEMAFTELLEENENDWFRRLPIIQAFRDALRVHDLTDSTSLWLTRMIEDGEEGQ